MTTADIRLITHRLDEIDTKLDRIESAVNTTNGRVTKLELWRANLTGSWVVLAICGPAISGVVVGLILSKLT